MNEHKNDESPCYILSIETSCDETAVAIVKDGHEVMSNLIASQIETHKAFGGVVPEVASRKHVESITLMLDEAVAASGIQMSDLSAIAVTQGPGLVGALLVGVVAAKSLSVAISKPLIGTHHIAGHIYANRLIGEIQYPCMVLVVSGGHTELVYMKQEGHFEVIGRTRDDAVGEAYDKVARSIGFPYPGGPHVDKMALESEETIDLPRAWLEPGSYDFSFSGLKSAVLNVINQRKMRGDEPMSAAIARGFQESVVDVLVTKAIRAVKAYDVKQLLLCGGVAANRGIRAELSKQCAKEGIDLSIPPFEYCTDNAAMIGAAAYLKWKEQYFTSLDMKADPQLSLEDWGNNNLE